MDRVAASQCFHSSARLKEFLLYVSDCALRNAPEEATEQHIGMHVFQRPPGYNSSDDSIVRTHARTLRLKLTEYFATEGLTEEIVISIPKGHYLPMFEPRAVQPLPAAPLLVPAQLATPTVAAAQALPLAAKRPRRRRVQLAAAAALIAALAISLFLLTRSRGPVERFWEPFFAGNASLVIYSNAVFLGDSTNGLRYASPMTVTQQPLPSNYVDHYTGIGELASVYDLTRLFDQHHASFMLKRSLLVTWDEARLNNLIFIGSVAENPSLRLLPSTADFTMEAGNGFSGFVNRHLLPGDMAVYQRPEHPLTRDYALLALLPGPQSGKKMLVFSGLTTLGTQAAVEFACRRDALQQLLSKVSDAKGEVRPFEAILETQIVGGVPMESRIVTVHVH